jgi:hypothetical protein
MPIGISIEGANRHDMKMLESTLNNIVLARPLATTENPQHMALDKGYDYPVIRELVEKWGYIAHIRTRGEEIQENVGADPCVCPEMMVMKDNHGGLSLHSE